MLAHKFLNILACLFLIPFIIISAAMISICLDYAKNELDAFIRYKNIFAPVMPMVFVLSLTIIDLYYVFKWNFI